MYENQSKDARGNPSSLVTRRSALVRPTQLRVNTFFKLLKQRRTDLLRTRDILISTKWTDDSRAVSKARARRRVGREQALKESHGRVDDHTTIASTVISENGDLPGVDNVGLNGTDLVGGTRYKILGSKIRAEVKFLSL